MTTKDRYFIFDILGILDEIVTRSGTAGQNKTNSPEEELQHSEITQEITTHVDEVTEIENEDHIGDILDMVLARMRMVHESNEVQDNSVHNEGFSVSEEISKDRKTRSTDTEDSVALLRSQQISTKSSGVSVGTLLAAIPDILEDHGVTFGAISNHLYNFEKALEGAVKSGFSEVAETMKQTSKAQTETMKQTSEALNQNLEKNSETLNHGFESIQKTIHQTAHENSETMAMAVNQNSETLNHGLDSIQKTIHQGLGSIIEKMEHNVKLEDTLHDGLHLISDKIGDKTKIDDTLHDGLHEITEQIQAVNTYGLSGLINTLDGHDHILTYPHKPTDSHIHAGPCKLKS